MHSAFLEVFFWERTRRFSQEATRRSFISDKEERNGNSTTIVEKSSEIEAN